MPETRENVREKPVKDVSTKPKSRFCGKKGRSGPKVGNLNALKNGSKMTRLTLGELPLTMRRQTQNARKYRRFLEATTLEAHGEVNVTHAHLIDEATNAEEHASVCRWLLRTRLETMKASDIASCSERILKAKTIRNKAVKQLNLDAPPLSPWIDALVVDENDDQ